MPLTMSSQQLHALVSSHHFATSGDTHEQQYGAILTESFPNCERFWQQLIVPETQRIEERSESPLSHRAGTGDDVRAVDYLHYSHFLHLAAAYDHLGTPLTSSFGDFYTHLGSACDLAEDFLLKVYLLVSECRGHPVPVLQQMSKEEFLDRAARWYDDKYPKAYENYHKKGKLASLRLPPRAGIIGDYLNAEEASKAAWKEYLKYSLSVRTYRNRIVHDVAIGVVLIGGTHHFVPRKERIGKYPDMEAIFKAANDPQHIVDDFIVREAQMRNDFQALQRHLNALWAKPIHDMTELLYTQKNPLLLAKYNLHLV